MDPGQVADQRDKLGLAAAAVPAYYNFGCGAYADPIFNDVTTAQRIDEDDVSGTLKFSYNFTPRLMSYVSYARGYKASGFNLDRERNPVPPTGVAGPPLFTVDADTSFAPETVDSYELGTKFLTSGRRLRMNATLFSQGAHEVLDEISNYTQVAEQAVPGWDNQQAATIFEQMYTQADGDIQGVLAANDGKLLPF